MCKTAACMFGWDKFRQPAGRAGDEMPGRGRPSGTTAVALRKRPSAAMHALAAGRQANPNAPGSLIVEFKGATQDCRGSQRRSERRPVRTLLCCSLAGCNSSFKRVRRPLRGCDGAPPSLAATAAAAAAACSRGSGVQPPFLPALKPANPWHPNLPAVQARHGVLGCQPATAARCSDACGGGGQRVSAALAAAEPAGAHAAAGAQPGRDAQGGEVEVRVCTICQPAFACMRLARLHTLR